MRTKYNESGIALISTLVLGLIAMGFISALFYMLTTGSTLSGSQKKYEGALEVSKGVTDYIIVKILDDQLTCNGGGTCNKNSTVDIVGFNVPGYTMNATLVDKIGTVNYSIYAFQIDVNSTVGGEKASIEFVYRVDL